MNRATKLTFILAALVMLSSGRAAESLLSSFLPRSGQLGEWKMIPETD